VNVTTPPAATRAGRIGIACYVASVALIVLTGLLGPSVVVLTLPNPHRWLPSYWFDAHPPGWVATLPVLAAIVIGAAGVWQLLVALERGWAPRLRKLVALGIGSVVAVIMVPPMASGDVLIHAAYGRIAATGGNPYETTPADIIRLGFDPVIVATERPWQNAYSIYGPIITGVQWLASKIAGDSVQLTVWLLQLSVAIAFVVAALAALKLVGPDLERRRRLVLLTLANPLLIWAVIAGAHNESIAVMFAVLALVALRRNVFLAGILLGCAGCSKLSIGLVGVAMLWALRGNPRKMLQLCVGAGGTMVALYAFVGLRAFQQARSQTSFISTGTPHKVIYLLLDLALPNVVARTIVGVAAWVGLIAVGILLCQVFPKALVEKGSEDDVTPDAVRYTAIYAIGWLLTSMYTLAWYDLTAWVALAMVGASRIDRLMVVRTAMLSLAYVPGRDKRAIDMSPSLEFVSARLRDTICPAVETVLLVALIVWARRRGAKWWPYDWPRRHPEPAPEPRKVVASGNSS
jgi:hypothetical protein